MKIKPEELFESPNKLAKFYSRFKVEERMLLTAGLKLSRKRGMMQQNLSMINGKKHLQKLRK
jgi:hypothetical protein